MSNSSDRIHALRVALASRYEIKEKIGAGGFAEVFAAIPVGKTETVALKLLWPAPYQDENAFLHLFHREALLTSALQHPNTVKPFDYGVEGGSAFIAMELLVGSSLNELSGKVSLEKVRDILIDILGPLIEAHKVGIVHADIKPANVIVKHDTGTAHVLDFGIARLTSDPTLGSEVFGTPHYMAPEVALGEPAMPSSDVYALGVAAFELATGKLPFDGSSPHHIVAGHVYEPFPELPAELLDTPVGNFILGATEKPPEARPTAKQALNILLEKEASPSSSFSKLVRPSKDHNAKHHLSLSGLETRFLDIEQNKPIRFAFVARIRALNELVAIVTSIRSAGSGTILIAGERGAGKRRLISEVLLHEKIATPNNQIFALSCRSHQRRHHVDLGVLIEQLALRFANLPEQLKIHGLKLAERLWHAKSIHSDLADAVIQYILVISTIQPITLIIAETEKADPATIHVIMRLAYFIQNQQRGLILFVTHATDRPVAALETGQMIHALSKNSLRSRIVHLAKLSEPESRRLLDSTGIVTETVVRRFLHNGKGNPGRFASMLETGVNNEILSRVRGRYVVSLGHQPSTILCKQEVDARDAEILRSVLSQLKLWDSFAFVSALGETFSAEELSAHMGNIGSNIPTLAEKLQAMVDWQILIADDENYRLALFSHIEAENILFSSNVLTEEERLATIESAAIVLSNQKNSAKKLRRAAEHFAFLTLWLPAAESAIESAVRLLENGNLEAAEKAHELADEFISHLHQPPPKLTAQQALGKARVALGRGDNISAREDLKKALKIAAEAKLHHLQLKIQLRLMTLDLDQGNMTAAEKRKDLINVLAKNVQDPVLVIEILLMLARYRWTIGLKKLAAKNLVEAEERSAKIGNAKLRAEARLGICRALINEGKLARADKFLSEAIRFLRQSSEHELYVEALLELSNLMIRMNRTERGEALLRLAEKTASGYGLENRLADILREQGATLLSAGKFEIASIPLLRALERYRAVRQPAGEGGTYRLLAECALHRGQRYAAESYLNSAYTSYNNLRESLGFARCLLINAQIERFKGREEQAISLTTKAIKGFKFLRAHRDRAFALFLRGRALRAIKKENEGQNDLKQARRIASLLGEKNLLNSIEKSIQSAEKTMALDVSQIMLGPGDNKIDDSIQITLEQEDNTFSHTPFKPAPMDAASGKTPRKRTIKTTYEWRAIDDSEHSLQNEKKLALSHMKIRDS